MFPRQLRPFFPAPLTAPTDVEVERRLPVTDAKYIILYMKQILIELDDRSARELERVAPAKRRMRAEFIRLAIRRALDLAQDRVTADAYGAQPLEANLEDGDLRGWDPDNRLAAPSVRARAAKPKPKARAA